MKKEMITIEVFSNNGLVEIRCSKQVNRKYIGVIDAAVSLITEETESPRKFNISPKGELIGRINLPLPEDAIWHPPVKTTTATAAAKPTSLGSRVRLIEAVKKAVAK